MGMNVTDEKYFECLSAITALEGKPVNQLSDNELKLLGDCEAAIRAWEEKHLPF